MTERYCPAPIDLSADWEFAQGAVESRWFDDGRGPLTTRLDLPHCWNTRDTQPEDRMYYRGFGNYRRTFELPPGASDVSWFLESGGFYGLADIRIDGVEWTHIDGQYLGFRIEIPESLLAAQGSHRLGIRLTNLCPNHVLPGIDMPDFILYGGLASTVRLVARPTVRLQEDRFRVRPVVEESGQGRVEVSAEVVNRSNREWRGFVHWEIRTTAGAIVAQADSSGMIVRSGDTTPTTHQMTVKAPNRWDLNAPNFYQVSAQLMEKGEPLDQVSRRVGFRQAEFRPNQGFFLNGRRVELRGCNRHENGWGLGNALPDVFHRRDAELFQGMGLNFVRLSHYPQSPAFLDACDELGILVYAEIATWKSVQSGRYWLEAAQRQLEGMIRRDRHHPSIVLWGLGNESRSRKAFLDLGVRVRRLDPDRPTIYAENHFYRAKRENTVNLTDVWGINYELNLLDQPIGAARLQTAVISECANYPLSRRGDFFAERHQVDMIKQDLNKFRNRPAIAGYALWCFADYATARKSRYVRRCGVVDGNRLPKMASHWLAASYAARPVLELMGVWHNGSGSLYREIHLFTNAVRTRVSADGEDAQIFEGGPHHIFSRKFKPRDLVAEATFTDGTVQTARLAPWGPAARLSIRPAFGEDLSRGLPRFLAVDLSVEDEAGNRVMDWNQPLTVWVIGSAFAALNNRNCRLDVGGGLTRFVLVTNGTAQRVVLRVEDIQGKLMTTVVLGRDATDTSSAFTWPVPQGRPLNPLEERSGVWDNCEYRLIFFPTLVPSIRRPWLNEHQILLRLGGVAGAPAARGLNVGKDIRGFVVVFQRERIGGLIRSAEDVSVEEAAQWGAQVAAIHDQGVLVGKADATDWVWDETRSDGPRWKETRSGILYQRPDLFFRWASGREIGWLTEQWFAKRPAQGVAFWESYRRHLRAGEWGGRLMAWGRRYQVLRMTPLFGEG